MPLFHQKNRTRSDRTRKVYAAYELVHTVVSFLAAICFVVGSILFLWPAFETQAIWLFIVGSAFFLAKPALRLCREVHLLRIGDLDTLADRAPD